MIDLLQVEAVPSSNPERISMDSESTSTNSKFPPLRRAALHFFSLLIRETTKQIYESSFGGEIFPDVFVKRARNTLSYLAATDEDNIVRVMAREAGEGLDQVVRAILGV